MSERKNIISQMFDVRPVDKTGDLDWKKIYSVGENFSRKAPKDFFPEKDLQEITPFEEVLMAEKEELEKRIKLLEEEFSIAAKKIEKDNGDFREKLEEKIARLESERKNLEQERDLAKESFEKERARLSEIEQEKIILENERLDLVRSSVSLQEKVLDMQSSREKFEKMNNFGDLRNVKMQFEAEKERVAEIEWEKRNLEIEKESFFRRNIILENKLAELEYAKRKEEEERRKKPENLFKSIWKKSKNEDDFEEFKDDNLGYQSGNMKSGPIFAFATMTAVLIVLIGGIAFFYKGLGIKGRVLGISKEGYESVSNAITNISKQDFAGSAKSFEESFKSFSEASNEIDKMGIALSEGSKFLPYFSKISSGKNVLEAGKHLSLAGKYLNDVLGYAQNMKTESSLNGNDFSMLETLKETESLILEARKELALANESIDQVKIDDLPEDVREKFVILKENLPDVISVANIFAENTKTFADMLGANGPRKYLFLFQNNNEIRATGGFIGSYGLLDMSNGRVRNFFIDGIFNPDGQLVEKIVPPKPIQKISASWSLHDSNWFPDFPTSAEKAILFYEKTGGPTADGIITMTPTVLEKLLTITGPIEMEEYGLILDSDNFVEKTQEEVETKGEENLKKISKKEESENEKIKIEEPKKILADLAPKILDKIFNSKDKAMIFKAGQAIIEGLNEKHILIYSKNSTIQDLISKRGWSGEMLKSDNDFLSVVNTNINGYKTDGVVDEKISHTAEIRNDGTIVNKVSITRKHKGGDSQYDWWNKVNADYMRIYVPLGAKLLKVEGQTREINEHQLEYDKLGFKKDPDVQREEDEMIIDENTGTRIYEEGGKTVFANWVYVSPKEETTIIYEYELPMKIFDNIIKKENSVGSYSLLVQKQSGSKGSEFESNIVFPENYSVEWKTANMENKEVEKLGLSEKLNVDKFIGAVFTQKE